MHGTFRMHQSCWTLCVFLSIAVLTPRTIAVDDVELLDRAARRYRMQVYESFRTNRPELDRRLNTAERLAEGWRDRGKPIEELPHLIRWFQTATSATRSGRPMSLPQYELRSDGSDRSDGSRESSGDRLAVDPPEVIAPHRPEMRNLNQEVTHSLAPHTTTFRGHQGETPHRPDDLPPMNVDDLVPRRPIEANRSNSDRLPAIRLHRVETNRIPIDPPRLAAAPATSVDEHAGPTRLPSHLPTAKRRSDVDLSVLSAKIRSANLSLAAVESDLADDREWHLDQLERAADDLSRLLDAADLVRIYYSAISADQQELVETLVDTGPIQALFAQRAFEVRIRLTEAARHSEVESVDDELDRLERVSEVMQRWHNDQQN